MKVAIVGSRGFPDLLRVRTYMMALNSESYETGETLVIVSGGAAGVDLTAREYARTLSIGYKEFPADWKPCGVYDPGAGMRRNRQIVAYADRVIAFWDGDSRGTKHTIDLALKAKKHLEVIFP